MNTEDSPDGTYINVNVPRYVSDDIGSDVFGLPLRISVLLPDIVVEKVLNGPF